MDNKNQVQKTIGQALVKNFERYSVTHNVAEDGLKRDSTALEHTYSEVLEDQVREAV